MKSSKSYRKLKNAFGADEYGFPMIPKKYSNVKISRLLKTDDVGGCTWCFPHGIELKNSAASKIQKNWKSYRKKQYKTSEDNNAYYKSRAYRKHSGRVHEFFGIIYSLRK